VGFLKELNEDDTLIKVWTLFGGDEEEGEASNLLSDRDNAMLLGRVIDQFLDLPFIATVKEPLFNVLSDSMTDMMDDALADYKDYIDLKTLKLHLVKWEYAFEAVFEVMQLTDGEGDTLALSGADIGRMIDALAKQQGPNNTDPSGFIGLVDGIFRSLLVEMDLGLTKENMEGKTLDIIGNKQLIMDLVDVMSDAEKYEALNVDAESLTAEDADMVTDLENMLKKLETSFASAKGDMAWIINTVLKNMMGLEMSSENPIATVRKSLTAYRLLMKASSATNLETSGTSGEFTEEDADELLDVILDDDVFSMLEEKLDEMGGADTLKDSFEIEEEQLTLIENKLQEKKAAASGDADTLAKLDKIAGILGLNL
jgi:GTP:adenosylcobinamide-phosphate guanylyltransferase